MRTPTPTQSPIILAVDLPDHALRANDVGEVIAQHANPDRFEVEFRTLGGTHIATLTLSPDQVRQPHRRDIPRARHLSL